MLTSDSPVFKKYMTKHVFKYRDPNMNFIKKVINQISYLREIEDKACLYDLIFNMERSSHSQGDIILKVSDQADSIIFVERGELEVFTSFEGNEFVLERLAKGAVINYRSFFLEDMMHVNIRCATSCNLLRLT
jgi:CRP-like cAMP-binding protein